MKIAMIGHKQIYSRSGGVEVVVEELAEGLSKKGHQIDVYDRHNFRSKKNKSRIKSINIYNIYTSSRNSLDALIYSFNATLIICFKKYDIVHYHSEGPSVMILLAKLFGKKVVATNHGLDWKRAKWGCLATKYLLLGEKISAKFSDELIVLSDSINSYFNERYGRNTVVIGNGVSILSTNKTDVLKKNDLEKNSYIIFLARIVPEKGLEYLIEAYSSLKTDKKLLIVGDCLDSKYLLKIKELCGNLINNKIILFGFANENEVSQLLTNSFLYVLPSDVEGMPISLLEAMYLGCDILASDIDENKNILQNYGEYFKKSNVEDLRIKLYEILSREGGLVDKTELKKYAKRVYGWANVIEETEKVYERVILKK